MSKKGHIFKRDKKGLSTVVANLLLILLVLIAIGIVWVVVRNIISSGTQSIELNQITFDFSVKSAYIYGSDIVVSVKRNPGGGTLAGLKFVFTNTTESVSVDRFLSMNELDTKTFSFNSSEVPGINAGDTVSIAPIYISSGSQKTGQVLSSETISGTAPPGATPPGGNNGGNGGGPTCGDGTVNQITEQCDLGSQNGVPGSGCTSSCATEQSSVCNNNGAVEGAEICDGNDLNGETCQSMGFDGGQLNCVLCQFDTSSCTKTGPVCGNNITESGEQCDLGALNGITGSGCTASCTIEPAPPSCNGVWDGQTDLNAGVECDGTPLPIGCTSICACALGFSPDLNGGCVLNSPLNSGLINSVWNNIYLDSQSLPKNATVNTFIGKYVNFSNSPEVKCFRITFADYIQQNNVSYIRVTDPFGATIPNISPGQGYRIWEAFNCGYQ